MSDIDLFAVTERELDTARRERVVDVLLHPPLAVPTRGLEFVLYERDRVKTPSRRGDFAVNLNVGPGMPLRFSVDPAPEPWHWFVLDRSIVRARGIALAGPPPAELFAEVPRKFVVEALRESLRWHAAHDAGSPNRVLNAARALRFVHDETWVSKRAAAQWAAERTDFRDVLALALTLRERGEGHVPLEEAEAFLDLARTELDTASARGGQP